MTTTGSYIDEIERARSSFRMPRRRDPARPSARGARVIAEAFFVNVALLVACLPDRRGKKSARALADATGGAARIER
jgi:hypothetical protein